MNRRGFLKLLLGLPLALWNGLLDALGVERKTYLIGEYDERDRFWFPDSWWGQE